jgi:hypothetical protein
MSKALTLEVVRKALSAAKGSTFHIDGGLVYIYHTILHAENHPIDLRYNNTNLYTQIKQGVSYFCDRMRRNLKHTDRAAIVSSQEEQSAMIKELYDVLMYVLWPGSHQQEMMIVVNPPFPGTLRRLKPSAGYIEILNRGIFYSQGI